MVVMALKKSKKKNKEQNIHKQIENEYLKKLEQAVSGFNGEFPYVITPQETKKKEQLKRLRKLDTKQVIEPEPQKDTPRIPIEWAINGEVETAPPPMETAPPSISIEEVVQEPAPEKTELPPPPPEVVQKKVPIRPEPKKREEPPPIIHNLLHEVGTIIRLEDGSIGIYKGPIPGKEYHLVYHLRPDGTIRPEGLYLYAYRSESLGRITPDVLEEMQRSMRWERDRILHDLSSGEKERLIPLLSPKVIKEKLREPPRKKNSLERGRLLLIGIGSNVWEAVYWGSDELGQIVAHNTNKVWTLMHLNLGRFGDSLEYGNLLSPEEIKEINESLSSRLSVGD